MSEEDPRANQRAALYNAWLMAQASLTEKGMIASAHAGGPDRERVLADLRAAQEAEQKAARDLAKFDEENCL